MKCLILVGILLTLGLAQGYNCPEEGIHFDDETIDCNMTVESWEDCGMCDDNLVSIIYHLHLKGFDQIIISGEGMLDYIT